MLQISEDQERKIVSLYKTGLGVKAISREIFGKETARPIQRTLKKFNVAVRTSEQGKAVSKAYQNRVTGRKPDLIKRGLNKRLKRKCKLSDLPLFEKTKKQLAKEYRERYQSDISFRVK